VAEGDWPLGLFQGYGVELEYMIVSREDLDVAPVCDRLIQRVAGGFEAEIELGEIAWSNELALHVLELKTNGPARNLEGLESFFQEHVLRAERELEPLGARLMPTAMHPWMNPHLEMRLWPHEHNAVYEAFDRIFDCRGHGWANLQSAHLNLPFSDAEEFGRLHAAIRLLLPILPALAASSPVMDGRLTGRVDSRLDVYRHNARRVPQVSGRVVPERADSPEAYQRDILEPLYAAIAPHDPDAILRHEWLNARGAIARFDRGAIEIRVLDVQECPAADIAVARAIVAILKALVDERWLPWSAQRAWPLEPLESLFVRCVDAGEQAEISESEYLAAFGLEDRRRCSAAELWRHLLEATLLPDLPSGDSAGPVLRRILERGTLSRRIAAALASGRELRNVYAELCDCLRDGRAFEGASSGAEA
jgi:gamma-glutamyl:cysteine ligase YbdK (ATP-grasp superfamily)